MATPIAAVRPPTAAAAAAAAVVRHDDDAPLEGKEVRQVDWNPLNNAASFVRAAEYHWKEGTINWPVCLNIGLVHTAALVGVATAPSCRWQTLLLACILAILGALGITGGSHRLWSHRSYKAHWSVRTFLMICSSLANQGSIYHWVRDHRVHHKHSEGDADPHNAARGFFFAHMGWLMVKKHPEVVKAGRQLNFADLEADPIVMFQHNAEPWMSLFVCFLGPALLPLGVWGEPFWNGLWVAGVLRFVVTLHVTWLVNSAAHFFGDHPYDATSWPAENPIVAVLSIGEGWHNWHHKYPFDYSASEFGPSTQFNPTRMFIDAMAVLGLVTDRKRATGAWEKAKGRRDGEESASSPLLAPNYDGMAASPSGKQKKP